jgi:peptidoglycan-associated lipoprotein
MKKAIVSIAVLLLAAACASKETRTESGVTDRSTGVTPPTASGTTRSNTTPQTTAGAINPFNDPNNPLSKHSVYFDFDSNAVKDEYRPIIQAHSRYLASDKRGEHVRIEGNCDERGSREYNIALGQRRADAVKRMMMLDGATDQQIETVSFGKEKPRNQGHDEGAWAENRRDDFVYAGE